MKHVLILEMIRKIKSQPHLIRKIKIFAMVGFIGLVFTTGLALWAGVSAIKFVAAETNDLAQSHIAKEQVEKLKTEMKGLPKIKPITCWAKVQSLMAVPPWVERPVMENLSNLKGACFEAVPATCEGANCPITTELISTIEGRTI